ncbi:MAG: cytochrome oxidase subunit III [Actinobacteria bacterium]|nr:cytochrome oxidase subunit III [Actinomycetota bacterium]
MRIDTELLSWWLFLACAIGFTAMAVRERDALFVVSSLFFLAACVVFLVGRRSD